MNNEEYSVKCFICGELTDRIDVIQTTNYTSTPICELVKTFIGPIISAGSYDNDEWKQHFTEKGNLLFVINIMLTIEKF